MPLQIGQISLPHPVALAPMAGVTDGPFRQLVRRFGVGLLVTEMIASREAIATAAQHPRLEADLPLERPVSVQLAGTDPAIMAEGARLCVDKGAEIIDINFGCPAKKVVKKYAGCALMEDEMLCADIMRAMTRAVPVPVTMKMRTGYRQTTRNAVQLARIAEDCGIAMIVVHGRTGCQRYKGTADWDYIAAVKAAVSIPILGNGDITTVQQAAEWQRKSGVDGVMIGRGAQGRPWFPGQVAHYLQTGEMRPDPTPAEKLQIILGHYQHMLDFHGSFSGLRRARKHLGWYLGGLRDAAACRQKIGRSEDPQEVQDLLHAAFAEDPHYATN